MSTEILGYIAQTQPSESPTETSVKPAEKSKAKQYYYIMQKLTGVILLELGALTIPLLDGDGTALIILLMFALPLIFSKEKILMADYYYSEEK